MGVVEVSWKDPFANITSLASKSQTSRAPGRYPPCLERVTNASCFSPRDPHYTPRTRSFRKKRRKRKNIEKALMSELTDGGTEEPTWLFAHGEKRSGPSRFNARETQNQAPNEIVSFSKYSILLKRFYLTDKIIRTNRPVNGTRDGDERRRPDHAAEQVIYSSKVLNEPRRRLPKNEKSIEFFLQMVKNKQFEYDLN